jgi:hypothetical protein
MLLNAAHVLDIPAADLELPPTCLLVYDREVVPEPFDYSVCSRHTGCTRVILRLRSGVQIFVKTLITKTIALDDGRPLSGYSVQKEFASSFVFMVGCETPTLVIPIEDAALTFIRPFACFYLARHVVGVFVDRLHRARRGPTLSDYGLVCLCISPANGYHSRVFRVRSYL